MPTHTITHQAVLKAGEPIEFRTPFIAPPGTRIRLEGTEVAVASAVLGEEEKEEDFSIFADVASPLYQSARSWAEGRDMSGTLFVPSHFLAKLIPVADCAVVTVTFIEDVDGVVIPRYAGGRDGLPKIFDADKKATPDWVWDCSDEVKKTIRLYPTLDD